MVTEATESPQRVRSTNRVAVLTISGFIGGLMGFVLSRIQAEPDSFTSLSEVNHHSGIWFMLIVVGIGAGIIAGNAYLNGSPPTGTQLAIGAGALLVGGYLAGYIAQTIYSDMVDLERAFRCEFESTDRAIRQCYASVIRPARAVGWMIAGGIAGAGVGAAFQSWVRVQNGVIGGAIGGLLGGLVFDSIGLAFESNSSTAPQFVGITLIGTLIGLLIGLIDTARSDKWLEVLTGEMRGRQFLLLDRRATIGSARSNTVVLLADRQIKESHLEIIQNQSSISFNCLMNEPVELNGSVTTTGSLRDGDVLTIGATQVRFGLRRSAGVGPGPTTTAPLSARTADSVSSAPSGTPGVRPTARQAIGESDGSERIGYQPPPTPTPPSTTPGQTPTTPRQRPRLQTKPPQRPS